MLARKTAHPIQRVRCLVCVNTEDCAEDARSVVGLVCVNTEDSAAYARRVVGLVCVNTEDGADTETSSSSLSSVVQ